MMLEIRTINYGNNIPGLKIEAARNGDWVSLQKTREKGSTSQRGHEIQNRLCSCGEKQQLPVTHFNNYK